MIKGMSVDFNPYDDWILDLLDDHGKHVNHILMAGGEEKWFLELDFVNMGKPVRIYFDINDAKIFKVKVGRSLKEQKGKGFNPDNMMLNPGGRKIDHIHRDFHNTEKRKAWKTLAVL
jgi:hypothetical protein